MSAPAIWQPELLSSCVILQTRPLWSKTGMQIDIDDIGAVAAEYKFGDKRYLVLQGRTRRHRFCVNGEYNGFGLTARIPLDFSYEIRSAATERLYRLMFNLPPIRRRDGACPTHYQRRRFVQLLFILDAENVGWSRRSAAFEILYPKYPSFSSAEWKASHERRRMYRMLESAHRLCASDYRSLLLGSPG